MPSTFAEKIFGAPCGAYVTRAPDLIMSGKDSAVILEIFREMDGKNLHDPSRVAIVLEQVASPYTTRTVADARSLEEFTGQQKVRNFHDPGNTTCYQFILGNSHPGTVITGSNSQVCTAGAFNTLANVVGPTGMAGLWMTGETWFRVPESLKVTLTGELKQGVYARDLSLWILGLLGTKGANYLSIEFHGPGVKTLTLSDRMVLAGLAPELGAMNAVFPPDRVLGKFLGTSVKGVWADEGAQYAHELEIDLKEVYPLVAVPNHVDNVIALAEIAGEDIHRAVLGPYGGGSLEDLREVAEMIGTGRIKQDVQLLIIPSSREVFIQAIEENLISRFLDAGAQVMSVLPGTFPEPSGEPPAAPFRLISSADRYSLEALGDIQYEIFLASPATVALSSLDGKVRDPRNQRGAEKFPYRRTNLVSITIDPEENRKEKGVWDYSDSNNLNTGFMFSDSLTRNTVFSDNETILEHLLEEFDPRFAREVEPGDVILGGENFGSGIPREHPAIGFVLAGIKSVIVKSVNRNFYRSALNQGLPVFILPDVVNSYHVGDHLVVDLEKGTVTLERYVFNVEPLPETLTGILNSKGLVNWLRNRQKPQ